MELDKRELILLKEEELLKSMENSDVDALNALIHQDLIFNIPNGQVSTKMMDLKAYSSGSMKVHEVKSINRTVNLIGDNAVVSVVLKMKGKFLKESFEGDFRVLRVWKEINKEWKVIAGSSMLLK